MQDTEEEVFAIYSKLVKSPSDIVGFVAYARYKQQKIEFIKAYAKSTGDPKARPSKSQIAAFYKAAETESALDGYRLQANELLKEYTEISLKEWAAELEENSRNEFNDKVDNLDKQIISVTRPLIKEVVKEASTSFGVGLMQNILANLAMVMLFALIAVIVWSSKLGISDVIEQIFNVKISDAAVKKPDVSENLSDKPPVLVNLKDKK